MKKLSFYVGVMLCVPLWVGAQTAPSLPPNVAAAAASVTDPGSTVSPVVYQSVFADTPTGVEMQSVDWKKANTEVGQFKRGHADILKWEESQPAIPGGAGTSRGTHNHPSKP